MKQYRFTRPPRALRRRRVTRDNVALVPASLLPYKAHWQRLANELPAGSVLVCVPMDEDRPRRPYLAVARALRQQGMTVRAVRARHLARSGS